MTKFDTQLLSWAFFFRKTGCHYNFPDATDLWNIVAFSGSGYDVQLRSASSLGAYLGQPCYDYLLTRTHYA